MSDELPGLAPGWLPRRSVRLIADEDRRERKEARHAERERKVKAEEAHNRALAAFRADAERRGDEVSVLDLISGEAAPTIADVLERARSADEARDAHAEKFRPGGRKPDAVMFTDLMPEPAPAARSETAREIASRGRHFLDRVQARQTADQADEGLRAVTPELGAAWRRESHRSDVPAEPASVSADEAWRRAYVRMGGYVL